MDNDLPPLPHLERTTNDEQLAPPAPLPKTARGAGGRTTASPVEWMALLVVLILAAVLRLGWPGLTEFKADEARLLVLALDMAEGKYFPVRGISSSVGFPNFPMSVWLYTLPLVLWKHVYAATIFTGLVNVLAVLGCWWFTRRYWGPQAALAAALLFTVSPWALYYSRKIWAQNLLPPLVMLWAISGVLALVEQRSRFILLHLLSLAIAIQTHLAAVALLPASAVLMFFFRRRIDWRIATAAGILAALTALPFTYYLVSAGLSPRAALDATASLEAGRGLAPFRYAWLLSVGAEIHSLAGPAAFRDYLAVVPELSWVHGLWSVFMIAGLIWLGLQVWQQPGQPATEAGLFVLVWLLTPPLFFVWRRSPVVLHYVISTYPAQYIAAGVAFAALHKGWHRLEKVQLAGRLAGWVVLVVSAAAQVVIWLVLLAFVGSRATPGGFGTPVAMQLQAATEAQHLLTTHGAAEVLVAGQGEQPEVDELAAVYQVLLRDVPHRFVDSRRSAVFPAAPAIVLLTAEAGEAAELYQAAAASSASTPFRAGEGAAQLLVLPLEAAPRPEQSLEPPPLLANWVTLLGYDGPAVMTETIAVWQLHWRTGTPASVDYHFFNHLLDASGERISQADAPAFAAWQWREGDVVVSRFHLSWPAGTARPLTIRSGMYTYPDLVNVPLLDVAANPYSDALEIVLPR